MDDLDNKLNTILGNPEIMKQIMELAGQIGGAAEMPDTTKSQPNESSGAGPIMDSNALRNISALLTKTGTDKNQQALLSAMRPYIGELKMQKLEKAMQAAKMAQLASFYLNNGGLSHLMGG